MISILYVNEKSGRIFPVRITLYLNTLYLIPHNSYLSPNP